MHDKANEAKDVFLNNEISKLKKIVLRPDGTTKIPREYLNGQKQDAEALIWQTDYGIKIIPLAADVRKVYLEVTTLCNFDCQTCIRNSWEDKLERMEMPVFDSIVKHLKKLPDLECVHFGGFGEPLSHPDIFTMIECVKALGVTVEMISNGSMLTEENAASLIDLGLDRLFISLDGPDEDTYNEIRIGADFAGVVENIKGLNKIKKARLSNRPELAIEFVAMKKNFHKLPMLAALLGELQAQYLLVTNVLPYCEELKDEILYDLDDTVPLFGIESALVMLRAHLPHMKLRTRRQCKFIEDKAMIITVNGNVSPCYALMHSYKCFIYGREKRIYPYHLGNVNEISIKDIWTTPEYTYFRSIVKDFHFPSCTDCRLLEGCTMADDNVFDCWGNSPSCADCLWSRELIACP